MTLHTTLRLAVLSDEATIREYGVRPGSAALPALAPSTLCSLRRDWDETEYLIIDEISMVSSRLLFWIDQRLRALKNNPGADSEESLLSRLETCFNSAPCWRVVRFHGRSRFFMGIRH